MPFYIKQLEKNIPILAVLHFLLGILISSRKDLATLWGLGIFFMDFYILFDIKIGMMKHLYLLVIWLEWRLF